MGKQEYVDTLCEYCDNDEHGYSQVNRNGDPDVDCSSLQYIGGRAAGYDLPSYNGSTWTMLADFTAAGYRAEEYLDQDLYSIPGGCIMLNVANHTEGVIAPGQWGGAHIDENGDIVGSTPGDQTGNEVSRCAPYHYGSYPNDWDYILYPPDDSGSGTETPTRPHYRVYTNENGWLEWMNGNLCSCSDPDCTDDFAGVEGNWIYDFECDVDFQLTLMDGTVLPVNDTNESHEQAIRGLTLLGDYRYQVHTTGNGWLKVEHSNDDDGAGDDQYAVDLIRIF